MGGERMRVVELSTKSQFVLHDLQRKRPRQPHRRTPREFHYCCPRPENWDFRVAAAANGPMMAVISDPISNYNETISFFFINIHCESKQLQEYNTGLDFPG